MNLTGGQLEAQYVVAISLWPFLRAVEIEHDLPPFLLYAVGSRETGLRRAFTQGSTGDGGHGHGLFQLDDRWHVIPDGFDTDAHTQAELAATMLAGLHVVTDDWVKALNRYNSGQDSNEATTGGDYGPDVWERRAHLEKHFGLAQTGGPMDEWHPRSIAAPANKPALAFIGAAPKIVLHTTETGNYMYDPSSYYGNCVIPETPVLCSDLVWRPAGDLQVGDALVGFEEESNGRAGRAWRRSVVERNEPVQQQCVRVVTSRGNIVASVNHPWLSKRHGYSVWKTSSELATGDELVWFAEPWTVDQTREGGWLAGMLDGEGSLHYGVHPYGGTFALQFAQKPGPVLDAFVAGMERRGLKLRGKASHDGTQHLVVAGGRIEVARTLGSLRPMRLLSHLAVDTMWERGRVGHTTGGSVATVLAVEPAGVQTVAGLQTSTRTYIAGGILCHNSYWPHATINEEGIHQHLPISGGAYALYHGDVETNTANAIQCEIVWYASRAAEMSDALLSHVADWCGWVSQQTGALLAPCPQGFHGPDEGMVLASPTSPIRFSDQDWLAFSGVCGHQHVGSGNDHWDPGAFPWDRFTALLGASTEEDDLAGSEEMLGHLNDQLTFVNQKLQLLVEADHANKADSVLEQILAEIQTLTAVLTKK